MILVTADILSFIKDNIDMVISILGLLGITSIVTVLTNWNYMNLMNPIRFTFEEIDRREKYIFFNPFIKTVFLVLLCPISIGSGVLLVFFLHKNIELDTNEILTNTFFSGLTFLVLSCAIFFLFILQEIIIIIKKILHNIVRILKIIVYCTIAIIIMFSILISWGWFKAPNPFENFSFLKWINIVIKNFDYKGFINCINIKDYINIKDCINIIKDYVNIYLEICTFISIIFIFIKKIVHPIINWITKNIFFVKVLGASFFQLSITFIFLNRLLYVYETKINISKKSILLLYILFDLIIFIYIFEKVYYNYSSRVNLSYLYYLDKNGKKVFIFSKTNDMWICSKKDYILCSKTEKNEFYKKTSEYINKTKKINDSKVKEKILEYIDKIAKYREYVRADYAEVSYYFEILDYCIENSDINSMEIELSKTIKKIVKITEINLVNQSDIPKGKLYPHTDNKDKFYSLL